MSLNVPPRRKRPTVRITPVLRRNAAKTSQTRYRADPRLSYLIAWMFPGAIVAPSTFVFLTGALTIPRLILFLTTGATLREFWRKLTTGGYVPIASDVLVPVMTAWMLGTLVIHQGASGLVGYGAVAALEFSFAYFLARVFFSTPSGYEQFVRVMRVVVALVLVSALMDTLSGQNLIARLGYQLSGSVPGESFPMRFGMIRAQGSLEHPILMGTFFVVSAVMFYHSTMRATEKIVWIGVCTLGAVLPLSSAPLLSLVMAFATVLFLRAFSRFPWRMIVMLMSVAFALIVFFAIVDDPLTTLIQNLTYDPQTGLFRVLIWQWVGVNISRAPWIGIGFEDWLRSEEMPPSIDSLYLVQAIRHGLPALVLLGLSILSTGITMPLRPQHRYPSERIMIIRHGMAIALFIFCFNAFTVHFWGSTWTMLAIVLGIRAGLTESVYLSPHARADEPLFRPDPPARRSRSTV